MLSKNYENLKQSNFYRKFGSNVKKSLLPRTHSCSNCGIEICRDTNAAINILNSGMTILGSEWQNSTSGQE
ncbi:zinc ribbon domain-containing protein [Nostoc sp. JL33]|uniref:zinc ribbon domain-containing protein n=1 Tax=Nostoc sp. JL33 TaxID=2815396 RepID=UPI0025E61F24|nr:zinc ribbon domain-containing protein [Nostoc sp. JL33]